MNPLNAFSLNNCFFYALFSKVFLLSFVIRVQLWFPQIKWTSNYMAA